MSNTFDSIKFSFPIKLCKRVQTQCFDSFHRHSPKYGEISSKSIAVTPIIGIKDICIDKLKEMVCIELSAKIRGKEYIDNINAESFDSVLEKIKSADLLYFRNDEVKKEMKIHRIDFSKNFFFDEPVENYINALSLIANPKEYNYQKYKNQSVTFSKNPLSKRRRLRFIFYDKFAELRRDKNFKSIDDINRYTNILRFEITLNNYYLIRKYLNIEKNYELNYFNVLDNSTNIFRNVYSELYHSIDCRNINVLSNSENKTLNQIEKEFGRKEICKNFDYDYKKVSYYLRSILKGNISKYLSIYRTYCTVNNTTFTNSNEMFLLNKIYKNVA